MSNLTTLRRVRTFLLRSMTPLPKKSSKPRKDNRNKMVSKMEIRPPAITTRMATVLVATNMETNSKTMEMNKNMGMRVVRITDQKANMAKKMNKLMDRSPAWNEVNHKSVAKFAVTFTQCKTNFDDA